MKKEGTSQTYLFAGIGLAALATLCIAAILVIRKRW